MVFGSCGEIASGSGAAMACKRQLCRVQCCFLHPQFPATQPIARCHLHTLPSEDNRAVLGCRALGKELCSQVLGSVFLPAEAFCQGCALIFRTFNPGLLPVISEGPFIISWEELLPRKKGKENKYSGQESGLDEEGLALNLLKPETGSFHDVPQND